MTALQIQIPPLHPTEKDLFEVLHMGAYRGQLGGYPFRVVIDIQDIDPGPYLRCFLERGPSFCVAESNDVEKMKSGARQEAARSEAAES